MNSIVLYDETFESHSSLFENAKYENYEGSVVLGRFNSDEIRINFQNMPVHNLIEISFQLNIHDTWDGNGANQELYPRAGGPDIWGYSVDEMLFETTFSNQACNSTYCLYQSYPDPFPSSNVPKNGRVSYSQGVCYWNDQVAGTSTYLINEIVPHNLDKLEITIFGRIGNIEWVDPLCDESWSIDNFSLTLIQYE